MKFKQENPTKSIKHKNFSEIPQRLWNYFLEEVNLKEEKWGDVNKKAVFRLAETISNHHFQADGKTTFKEEFVSAGGVQINQVNPHTMESKTIPNLYFAGECLDIDGVTGGFNFQAAWSTAYVASLLKS